MAQLTYPLNPAVSRAGMIADARVTHTISRLAEGAAVRVGLLCVQGTGAQSASGVNPGQVKGIADATADTAAWLGVPVWDPSDPNINATDYYAAGSTVPLLRKGTIWVYTETAASPATAVYVRTTAAGADVNGQFRAGAATNFVAAPANFKFLTATTAAGLIILEIG